MKWFEQQLKAVVRNQGELIAYMSEAQIELMFDIGRNLGFKSKVVCVHTSSKIIVHRAEHETWDDFDLEIVSKRAKGSYEVRIKYWDKKDPKYIDRTYELQMLDDRMC